jgi:hypothetical protein
MVEIDCELLQAHPRVAPIAAAVLIFSRANQHGFRYMIPGNLCGKCIFPLSESGMSLNNTTWHMEHIATHSYRFTPGL